MKRNIKTKTWGLLVVSGLLLWCATVSAQTKVVVVPLSSSKSPSVTVVTTSDSIQEAIGKLPAAGGTVFIKAGTHALSAGIHINRSNVSVIGEQGTILKLKNGVNQPVILIGTDIESPAPANEISNITIADLEINGNQTGQSSETDPSRPHIRNNGIDIRTVSNLWIENIDVHDARSGGIVASWKSSNIYINKVTAHDNYYDGIALYDSANILVTDFICNSNDNGAGLSLDNALSKIVFSNGIIQGNDDVGIFARNSDSMTFSNIIVSGNGNHGAFLSHDIFSPSTTGVHNILFTGCSFIDNSGYGIQLASPSANSNKNAVTGTLFNNNTTGCLTYEAGSMTEGSNVCF